NDRDIAAEIECHREKPPAPTSRRRDESPVQRSRRFWAADKAANRILRPRTAASKHRVRRGHSYRAARFAAVTILQSKGPGVSGLLINQPIGFCDRGRRHQSIGFVEGIRTERLDPP